MATPTNNTTGYQPVSVVKALYFITNNCPNELVALEVYKDGHIGSPVFYKTGGDGSSIVHQDTGKDIDTDTLGTQGSVVRMGNVSTQLLPPSSFY